MRIPALLVFLLFFSGLKSQDSAAFARFGERLFRHLTDTGFQEPVEYVRIKTLHWLIDQQELSAREKALRHAEEEAAYDRNYEIYHKQMFLLRQANRQEVLQGGQFALLHYQYEPLSPKSRFLYRGRMRVIFEGSGVRTLLVYRFRFFFNQKGFGLLGPIESEGF